MPASKIVDEGEALQWIAEGRTYAWIVKTYLEKYNVETTENMWENLRRRRGLPRRHNRDVNLIPWQVRREHQACWSSQMIRREARRRAGFRLRPDLERALDGWLKSLDESNMVIHYDPDEGWSRVPRREGVDKDIIRVPERKTTKVISVEQSSRLVPPEFALRMGDALMMMGQNLDLTAERFEALIRHTGEPMSPEVTP